VLYNGAIVEQTQVIIIGAGPAGMAAAIQLKRYGITPLVFEMKRAGGLLWNANSVENYPGFPGGIPGPALVAGMVRQFEAHNLTTIEEKVVSVDYRDGWFVVESNKADYAARIVVIATGTRPNHFPEGFIPEQVKERVCYEVADLVGVKDKQVLIVGAGDAAFDYALNLARLNDVLIANRGSEIKALPLLQERVNANQRIRYMENTRVERMRMGDGELVVQLAVPDGVLEVNCAYLLGAIGRTASAPRISKTLQPEINRLQKQHLLFIIGDVKNGIFRQTSIAVGDGVKAAMQIFKRMGASS
jgi:thioredoxin reductase